MQHPQLEHEKLSRLSLVSHKRHVDGTHRGEGVSRWWGDRCEVMRCEERDDGGLVHSRYCWLWFGARAICTVHVRSPRFGCTIDRTIHGLATGSYVRR